MNEFITNIAENVTFVLEFLALVAALVAVAVIAEKLLNKRNGNDSKIDPSELPVLICGFAFGPVAGVLTEFVKIIIKLFLKPTSTAFVGELANFCVGCSMILPATIIYHARKSKTTAIVGCVAGTVVMTIFGTLFNAVYLLPTFAVMYGMPLDALIGMGTALNANVTDVFSFVAFCVAPLNLIKGAAVSVLTFVLYKPLSPILKTSWEASTVRKPSQTM